MPKILFAAYLGFQYHLVSCTFIVAGEYGISTSTCPKYQMLKGRNWKCGWCSCPAVNIVNNYWYVFWGPFRSLSKAMTHVCTFPRSFAFLHGHAAQLWCWQPRQRWLTPLYSLHSFSFSLRFCHELGPCPSVRWGQKQWWIFLWVGVMTLNIKSGGRRRGRREGDFNSLGPLLLFLYRSQSIFHGA